MIKYLAFSAAFMIGTPLAAWLAWSSAKYRGYLVTALIASTALGDLASINFVSMEAYRGTDRGFEVTLTDLLALALAAALVAGGRVRWWPRGSTLLWLLFVAAAVTVWQAPVPLYGSFTLFKLARAYVLFWVIANAVHAGVTSREIWRGLTVIGVFVTMLALKQKYVDGIYRVPGPFDHSNTIPLYANLVMPVLLAWSLTDRALSKVESAIGTGAALGLTVTVVATFSRAGTALAGVALLATLVLANRGRSSSRVRWASALVLAGAIVIGAASADSIIDRINNAPEASEEARDEFNLAAAEMLADHPFGVGLNNFSLVLTENVHYRENLTVMANEEQAGVCHHIYRLMAAELGYPGAILFILMLAQFVLIAAWYGWRRRSTPEGLALMALAIGMVTLHVSGFLEWGFRITPVTYQFAVVAGLAAGLSARTIPTTSGGAIRPVTGRMASETRASRRAS